MPYIGNTIRAADDYRLIDDISSSFNGSTTSFALQVAGSAPVPFPKSPQQVLISVNGVIQEPDPTGASGFNLVGTNIVFSSAPTNGHAFFGIIYATADYLNAGGNFPAGSLGAPSITFIGDENSGLFRKGSGSVGFVSDATEIANFDSNGITISSGNIIIPDSIIHNGDSDTKIRFPSGNTISFETGGAEKFRVDGGGHVSVGTNTSRTVGGAVERKLQVEGPDGSAGISIVRNQNSASPPALSFGKQRSGSSGGNTIVQDDDKLGTIQFCGADGTDLTTSAASIQCEVDGTPGSNDMPGRLLFSTTADGASSSTERLRIDSSGNVVVKTNNVLFGGSGTLRINSGSTFGTLNLDGGSSNHGGEINLTGGSNGGQIQFRTGIGTGQQTEKMRLDSSGRLLIGTTTEGASTADDLTIATSGNTGITIRSGTSSNGNIFFSDAQTGNAEFEGYIQYDHSSNYMRFATGATERVRIDSSGFVGIGTDSPERLLHVSGSDCRIRLSDSDVSPDVELQNSSGDGVLTTNAIQNLRFNTNNAERLRITGTGQVIIGTTSNATIASSANAMLQVEHTSGAISAAFYSTVNASGPSGVLALGHGRGSEGGALQDNDLLGQIRFAGGDGSDCQTQGAAINAEVNGTPSSNNMPCDLIFYTNNGSSSVGERVRIVKDGDVAIGTSSVATDCKVSIAGNVQQFNNTTGTGASTKTIVLGRTYTMTTSTTNLLTFDNWGTSAFDITVFRRDNASPAGANVTKIYLAFHGSGTNITQVAIAQESKVTRGSIHGTTFGCSENNNTATLTVTGDNTGGETQDFTFYIVGRGNNAGSIVVV